MSYSDCISRITELDSLLRSVDSGWAASGNSLVGTAGMGLVSGSPFAGVLEGYANAQAASATSAASVYSTAYTSSYAAFSSPLPGARLTQDFGPSNEIHQPQATVGGVTYAHYHNGIDLAAPEGRSVLAAGSGTVTFAGRQSDGAVVVKIKHDNGYTSLYAHLDALVPVKVGDRVSAGQVVGKVGMTGITTGPHLHFGLYSPGGTAVNPSISLTAGRMPDPTTLLGPDPNDSSKLATVSGSYALSRFDAVSSRIPYAAEIRTAATANGIDPLLLASLVYAESGFRPTAVSSCGAQGLTQLMPRTARSLGVTDSFDPLQNLNGGAKYIARQLKSFGRVDLALAAYNAGPGAIGRLGAVPDSKMPYVSRILGKWNSYQEAAA
jgi:hypothetical protein